MIRKSWIAGVLLCTPVIAGCIPIHPVSVGGSKAPVTRPAPKPTAKPVSKPAPPPTVTPTAPAWSGAKVDPRTFGAVGNGVADDTAALERAMAALHTGDTLVLASGMVYRHTDVLRVTTPGVRLTGGGELLATNEQLSSVWLDADNILVDDLTFTMGPTTKRWDAWEQMKLRVMGHSGITVRGVTIDGSASAGIYVGNGASKFLLEDDVVRNTRSDGIHMTDGSHDGVVRRPVVSGTGDDSVAVVSYAADPSPCYNISVISPKSSNNAWGRAFSVVGGHDITWSDVNAVGSSSAAIYIATEGAPYFTYSVSHVSVTNGLLENSNTNTSVQHGAVLIYAGNPGSTVSDVSVTGLTILNTRSTSGTDVSLRSDGGTPSRITLSRFAITGGPENAFGAEASMDHEYRLSGWSQNGRGLADVFGW